jgi:hypothetical protein
MQTGHPAAAVACCALSLFPYRSVLFDFLGKQVIFFNNPTEIIGK